jgi:hypothetical protein
LVTVTVEDAEIAWTMSWPALMSDIRPLQFGGPFVMPIRMTHLPPLQFEPSFGHECVQLPQWALVVVSVHVALQQVPFVTPICEHDAPSLFPVGLQSGCPVLHDQVPVWQAFDGVHAPVCVHDTHAPL